MDRKIKSLCVFAIVLSMTHAVWGEEADRLQNALKQPSAYRVNVTQMGSALPPSAGLMISGVGEFLIDVPNRKGAGVYDLYFFFDGNQEDSVTGVSLPYVFKQNFRGFSNGTYKAEFILINQLDQVGKAKQTINVKHAS